MTSRIEGDRLGETWRAQVSGASLTTIDLGFSEAALQSMSVNVVG